MDTEKMLEWMRTIGTHVNARWMNADRHWEVDWVVADRHYSGRGYDLTAAVRDAIMAAVGEHPKLAI